MRNITLSPGTSASDSSNGSVSEGRLPDFVIIGAMKCGTTSLYDYLNLHPEVSMSHPKELNFFTQHQRWRLGVDWYKDRFAPKDEACAARVRGEASPNYTRHPLFPGVPERMCQVVPNAKLIYCVRDPVSRAMSHYVHDYSIGEQDRPFAEAVLDEKEAYLWCSRYFHQLEQYLKVYDASQIKVVVLEDMKEKPYETLGEVFAFLGVDPSYRDERFRSSSGTMPSAKARRRNFVKSWMRRNGVRGMYWLERNLPWVLGRPIKQPEINEELHRKLLGALEDDTQAFRALTGLELPCWRWVPPR